MQTFIYDRKKLNENYSFIKGYGNVYYTLKANSSKQVLKFIKENISEGDGFCISSKADFYTLENLQTEVNKICCINVLLDFEDLIYLYKKGVRKFVFDDYQLLQRFSQNVEIEDCEIIIRLNISEIFSRKISHLGTNTTEMVNMFSLIESCKRAGISLYFQKNIKLAKNYVKKGCKFIRNMIAKYDFIKVINIGGINEDVDFKYLLELKNPDVCLNIETGTRILKDVMELHTHLLNTKEIGGKNIIVIKNGIFSGFFDVIYYKKKFSIAICIKKEIDLLKHRKRGYKKLFIYGGSGDSGDFLGKYYIDKNIDVKKIKEIIVKDIAGYFGVFFMKYGTDIELGRAIYKEKNYEI